MSRAQIYGTITAANFATEDEPGFIRVQLDDGTRVTIEATDEEVQGYRLGGCVRMPAFPTRKPKGSQ